MNYKKHKIHRHRRLNAQERRSNRTKGWTYGGAIAREVVGRREFKNIKREVLTELLQML